MPAAGATTTGGPRNRTGLLIPAPGSILERTDQGVDFSNIPGNIVAVGAGRITNVYNYLSGFAYTIIEKLSTGQEVYYGLETGGTPIGVRPGQQVAAGQAVARGRGTGGIEVGYWNPATGKPVGQGAFPTAAGTQFAKDIGTYGQSVGTRVSASQNRARPTLPAGVTQAQATVILAAARILMAAGYSAKAAAGVIGNAKQESTWNPASIGSGGGGLWGFTAAPKSLADLQAYASQQGVPWTNVALQTRFLLKNSSASDRRAMNAQPTPEDAASWWMTNWERPLASSENEPNRRQGAALAYQIITGNYPSGVGTGKHGGTRPGGGSGGTQTGSTLLTAYNKYLAVSGAGAAAGATATGGDGTRAAAIGGGGGSSILDNVGHFFANIGGTIGSTVGKGASAVSGDVTGAADQAFHDVTGGWHAVTSAVNSLTADVTDVVDFLDKVWKFVVNPMTWLRILEFIAGGVMMYQGMKLMIRNSGSRARSNILQGSIITPITRDIGAARQHRRRMEYQETGHRQIVERQRQRSGGTSAQPRPATRRASTRQTQPQSRAGRRRPAQSRASRGGSQRSTRQTKAARQAARTEKVAKAVAKSPVK